MSVIGIFHQLPQHNFIVAKNCRQRGYFLQPSNRDQPGFRKLNLFNRLAFDVGIGSKD
jgi:hypothetical protein